MVLLLVFPGKHLAARSSNENKMTQSRGSSTTFFNKTQEVLLCARMALGAPQPPLRHHVPQTRQKPAVGPLQRKQTPTPMHRYLPQSQEDALSQLESLLSQSNGENITVSATLLAQALNVPPPTPQWLPSNGEIDAVLKMDDEDPPDFIPQFPDAWDGPDGDFQARPSY